MAKPKVKAVKAKKTSTKYSKLLAVAAKELASKKKALVLAERSLGKAKERHEELISEVARLDMVERSLKAIVDGTEPPTNVKYVYSYPQWVWYPQQPYVTYQQPGYWNGGIYQQPGYWSNGQWVTPPQSTTIYNKSDMSTINHQYSNNVSGMLTNTANNFTVASGATSGSTVNAVLTSTASAIPTTWTSGGLSAGGEEALVIDLTTHSEPETVKCDECGGENDGATEMHRLECPQSGQVQAAIV
jgi:hypothetical protein